MKIAFTGAEQYLQALISGVAQDARRYEVARAVAQAFWTTGTINQAYALYAKQGLLRAADAGAAKSEHAHVHMKTGDAPARPEGTGMQPFARPGDPELMSVTEIGRTASVASLGEVEITDLETWSDGTRINVNTLDLAQTSSLSGLTDLTLVDDAGATHSLAFSLGRGCAVEPAIDPGNGTLRVRTQRDGPTSSLQLGATAKVADEPGTQMREPCLTADAYMQALVEQNLRMVMGDRGRSSAQPLERVVRAVMPVAVGFHKIGVLPGESPYCRIAAIVDALAGCGDGRTRDLGRYVRRVAEAAEAHPRTVAVARRLGDIDGVTVVVRSIEMGRDRARLNLHLGEPVGCVERSPFGTWLEVPWRAEDDDQNLYLGWWGASWTRGEYGIDFTPAVPGTVKSLVVTRSGRLPVTFRLELEHSQA